MAKSYRYLDEYVKSDTADHGAVSVSEVTPTLIRDTQFGRISLVVQNSGSTVLAIGTSSSLTLANGVELAAGASITFDDYMGPVYGLATTSAIDTRYWETRHAES